MQLGGPSGIDRLYTEDEIFEKTSIILDRAAIAIEFLELVLEQDRARRRRPIAERRLTEEEKRDRTLLIGEFKKRQVGKGEI